MDADLRLRKIKNVKNTMAVNIVSNTRTNTDKCKNKGYDQKKNNKKIRFQKSTQYDQCKKVRALNHCDNNR